MYVTLVIPLRDEEHSVRALIDSIASQTRPPDAVIFVDAGSVDRTPGMLKHACATRPHWSVEHAGPASPGRARNIGIEASEGDWIALTDAGVELDRYWLARLVRAASAVTLVELVWGHHEPAPDGWFTQCAALAYLAPPKESRLGPVMDSFIASCLLRREVWVRAGHFPDLRAAEDGIFMRRLEELGTRTALAPEAVVWWHLEGGFRRTFARFRTYSKVNALAGQQRHWHHGVARIYVAGMPFFVLTILHHRLWGLLALSAAALRVERSIWRGRRGRGVLWAANPARFLTVAAILAVVDAATFTGWLEASVSRVKGV
jgi:glycosyltransferase involved in cell wall biosynthesis